jgi:hypothetical protein
MARRLYPMVEWVPVDGVYYNGMPILRHPGNGEIGCDSGEHLLDVPANILRAIQDGVKGMLK